MLFCDLDDYPTLTVTFRNGDWNTAQVKRNLNDITEAARFCESRGHCFNILVVGNAALDGDGPPLNTYAYVVDMLVRIRSVLRTHLVCTAIYTPTSTLDKYLSKILMLYKPSRPVRAFKTSVEDCKLWIEEQRSERRAALGTLV